MKKITAIFIAFILIFFTFLIQASAVTESFDMTIPDYYEKISDSEWYTDELMINDSPTEVTLSVEFSDSENSPSDVISIPNYLELTDEIIAREDFKEFIEGAKGRITTTEGYQGRCISYISVVDEIEKAVCCYFFYSENQTCTFTFVADDILFALSGAGENIINTVVFEEYFFKTEDVEAATPEYTPSTPGFVYPFTDTTTSAETTQPSYSESSTHSVGKNEIVSGIIAVVFTVFIVIMLIMAFKKKSAKKNKTIFLNSPPYKYNATTGNPTSDGVAEKTTYPCTRCKKEITDNDSEWVNVKRYCKECAAFRREQNLRMVEKSLNEEKRQRNLKPTAVSTSELTLTTEIPTSDSISEKTTYPCTRCKKEITDNDSEWVNVKRYCKECAAFRREQNLRMAEKSRSEEHRQRNLKPTAVSDSELKTLMEKASDVSNENLKIIEAEAKKRNNLTELQDELAKMERIRLEKLYPDYDAWRAPRNIGDSMACVGYAMYKLDAYKARLAEMSTEEIRIHYSFEKFLLSEELPRNKKIDYCDFDAWCELKGRLHKSFKENDCVELYFLREDIDGKNGHYETARAYRFKKGEVYTCLDHLNVANFRDCRTSDYKILRIDEFERVLERKKSQILPNLTKEQKEVFNNNFEYVKAFLMSKIEGSGYKAKTEKETAYPCTRCKKEISESKIKWINGKRYCDNCSTCLNEEKMISSDKNKVEMSKNQAKTSAKNVTEKKKERFVCVHYEEVGNYYECRKTISMYASSKSADTILIKLETWECEVNPSRRESGAGYTFRKEIYAPKKEFYWTDEQLIEKYKKFFH